MVYVDKGAATPNRTAELSPICNRFDAAMQAIQPAIRKKKAMRDTNIDTLIRGSELTGRSSQTLGWQDIAVERRIIEPHFRNEESLNRHYIVLWGGQPTVVERAYKGQRFTRMVKQPGSLSLGAAGIMPAVRALTAYDVVVCLLSPDFVDRCSLESDLGNSATLHEHLGVTDNALSSLIRLAAQEAQAGGPTGSLYADSLAQAVACRFMHLASEKPLPVRMSGGLAPHTLRRVLDRIVQDFNRDLSLNDLAIESGYSRAHFLRMFRASTGYAPHHFLMKTRLEFVQMQLRRDDISVSDLAIAAGFSSHSHLTETFRKWYGITPTEFKSRKGCASSRR